MSDFVFEFKRQSIHLFFGCLASAYVFFLKPFYGWVVALPLLALAGFFYVFPTIGSHLPLHDYLMAFERHHDRRDFPYKGVIYFILGVSAPIILLPSDLCAAVILVLGVGDSISTVVGKSIGRTALVDKTLEGFAAFVLSSFFSAMFFVGMPQAMFLAAAGALIEVFVPWDDNLSIPWLLTLFALLAGLP